MRRDHRGRSLGLLGTTALLLSACGSAATPTQPAGAGSTSGAQPTGNGGNVATEPVATDQPAATQAGNGGGDGKSPGWDQYGKVHVDMAGPVTKSADYGFVPAGSLFGGAQGSSLNFSNGNDEIVSILIGADNKVIVSYGGQDFSMPGAECTTSNWNVGATSASGSFDCKAAITILASGASAQNGTIKGTFDAHA